MERELVVGAPGTATSSVYYPKAMNALVGTRFKIVSGYPGGNDVNLAMERGEVGGRGSDSWASWKSTKPHWLRREEDFHSGSDRARPPSRACRRAADDRARQERGRPQGLHSSPPIPASPAPFVTAPDTPRERVAALRRAFDATMKDPQFLAEAEKAGMDISPRTGEEPQKVAGSIADTEPAVLARAKAILDNLDRGRGGSMFRSCACGPGGS